MTGPPRQAHLINLGTLPVEIDTVGRGGLNPKQVAAALAARDRQIAQLRADLAVAREQTATAAGTLTQWHTWHRDKCLGPASPASLRPDPNPTWGGRR